ncbi:plasmid maintenance protein CcdB [Salmonella enterica]|nr:plasmid maintenance protein CcdB [Salmonella enterica]
MVVPLVSKKDLNLNKKRITPTVEVERQEYYIFTPAITFLDSKKIEQKHFMCNVSAYRNDIVSAIDAIITNT